MTFYEHTDRRTLTRDAWLNTHVGNFVVNRRVDRAAFEAAYTAQFGPIDARTADKITSVIRAFETRVLKVHQREQVPA